MKTKETKNVMLRASLIMSFLLATGLVFAAFSTDPFVETWKHKLSNWNGKSVEEGKHLLLLFRRLVRGEDRIQLDSTGLSCHSELHFEQCLAIKPVIIDKNASTVYIPSDEEANSEYKIKPYARKEDETAMKEVTPVRILHGNITAPPCNFIHKVPVLIFSSGGFTGNLFHEFNEIIIPLFLSSRHLRSSIQFVITDFKLSWVEKYSRVLSHLSSYEVINPVENGSIHCFPAGAIMGLRFHDNLAINYTEIPGGYTMLDFTRFLRESYMLKTKHVIELKRQRPVLLLLSRHKSRMFLNEEKMVEMMQALGFQVIAAMLNQTSNLDTFSGLVNSCSVIVGAHGAGLTNVVFLPTKAVVVQVVPLGLDWPSTAYYGETVGGMGLDYLEYKIKAEESSLVDVYGPDHPVITDPQSVFVKGYRAARAIYVDGQNLKIDLVRFRKTLVEAMKLLGHFVPEN